MESHGGQRENTFLFEDKQSKRERVCLCFLNLFIYLKSKEEENKFFSKIQNQKSKEAAHLILFVNSHRGAHRDKTKKKVKRKKSDVQKRRHS